jgi:hypothetical protein
MELEMSDNGTLWRSFKNGDSTVEFYTHEGSPAVEIVNRTPESEDTLVLMTDQDVMQFLFLITSNGYEEVLSPGDETLDDNSEV